ncbi:MAG: hypothetical protein ACRD0G_05120 [Acidimicrobiales bacterium]
MIVILPAPLAPINRAIAASPEVRLARIGLLTQTVHVAEHAVARPR